MTVCRFFLENRCRYGENCRFAHPRGGAQQNLFGGPSDNSWQGGGGQRVTFRDSFGAGGQGAGSQYKWVSNQQGSQSSGPPSPPTALELVEALPRDMETWEKSKMWPFSCVAVEKDLPSLPEFHDVSADELRLEAYQGMKSGNMHPYTQRFQSLISEFQNKRMQLKHMTMELKSKLVNITEAARKKKAMQPSSTDSLTSAFGSSQPSQGLFGQSQSTGQTGSGLFGQPSSGGGLFGKPASGTSFGSSPGGLFGSGTGMSSASSGTAFGAQGSSLFGKPAGTGSVFGNQTPTQVPQTSNVFGHDSSGSQSASPGLFGQPASQGQPTSGLFGSGSSMTTNQSNLFGSGGASPSQGLFGKPATGFGETGSSPSLFGNSSGSTVQTSTAFGSPSLSLFGNAAAQGQQSTLFGKPVSASPSASQSVFGSATPVQGHQQGQAFTGLFGKGAPVQNTGAASTSLFGSSTISAGTSASVSVLYANLYTPLADLTDQEKEAFSAKAFELGKIPLRPPPKEMINT